jgi:glucose/arabinose dehydrogenase
VRERVAIALGAVVTAAIYAQRDSPDTYRSRPKLAPLRTAETKNFPTAGKWPATAAPKAGFRVQRFAEGLVSPRWLYVLPNGDVPVAEASTKPKPAKTPEDKEKQKLLQQAGNMRQSADRITLLRDAMALPNTGRSSSTV